MKMKIHGIEEKYKYPIKLIRVRDLYKKSFLKGADRKAIRNYKKQLFHDKYEPIFVSGKFVVDGTHRVIAAHQLGMEYIKAYVDPLKNPPKFKIRTCKLADWDHNKEQRNYAHVNHKPNIICVAKAFEKLPENHQIAILAHEVGHLFSRGSSEESANRMAQKIFGVPIRYIHETPWGQGLQYISDRNLMMVRKQLKVFVEGSF